MSHIKIPSAPVLVVIENRFHRAWNIEDERETDPLFWKQWGGDSQTFDAREYLDAFMKVRSPENALAFLNRFDNPSAEPSSGHHIRFSEFRALQRIVRIVARTPLSEWPPTELQNYASPENVSVRLENNSFTFVHSTYWGISGCCAQVFFEKLSGVEFRWCARPDCDQIFRKATGHDKIYCTPECAHLMAVRANRARAGRTRVRTKRSYKRR